MLLFVVLCAVIAAFIFGFRWSLPPDMCVLILILILMAVGVVSVLLFTTVGFRIRRVLAGIMVILTAVSREKWAFSLSTIWSNDRVQRETAHYGAPVGHLIANYQTPTEPKRPERRPLGEQNIFNIPSWSAPGWASSYYSGSDAIGGNVNLKGTATYYRQEAALAADSTRPQAESFLSAPGIGISSDTFDAKGQPSIAAIDRCVTAEQCGQGLTLKPVAYAPGYLRHDIKSMKQQTVTFNESYFPGWVATVTPADGGEPKSLTPSLGVDGMTQVEMPNGLQYLLYIQRGAVTGWLGFGVEVTGQLAGALAIGLRTRRRYRRGRSQRTRQAS